MGILHIESPTTKDIFDVDFEPTDTILTIKQRIVSKLKDKYPAITETSVRLIYKTSILTDMQVAVRCRLVDEAVVKLNIHKSVLSQDTTLSSASSSSPNQSPAKSENLGADIDENQKTTATNESLNMEAPKKSGETVSNNGNSASGNAVNNRPTSLFNMFQGSGSQSFVPSMADTETMLNNPMMKDLMKEIFSDPEIIKELLMMNPAMEKFCSEHPEALEQLSQPEMLKTLSDAITDPEAMKDLMRQKDNIMANVAMMPGGHGVLSKMDKQIQEVIDTMRPAQNREEDLFGEKSVDGGQAIKNGDEEAARDTMIRDMYSKMTPELNNKITSKMMQVISKKMLGGNSDLSGIMQGLTNNSGNGGNLFEGMNSLAGRGFNIGNLFGSAPVATNSAPGAKKGNEDEAFYSEGLPLGFSDVLRELNGPTVPVAAEPSRRETAPQNNPFAAAGLNNFGGLGGLGGLGSMESVMGMLDNPMYRSMMESLVESPDAFRQAFNNPMVSQMYAGTPMLDMIKNNPELIRMQIKNMLDAYKSGGLQSQAQQQTPASPQRESTIEELKVRYRQELVSLREMMICNDSNEDQILRLLEKHDGDVNAVVLSLLD